MVVKSREQNLYLRVGKGKRVEGHIEDNSLIQKRHVRLDYILRLLFSFLSHHSFGQCLHVSLVPRPDTIAEGEEEKNPNYSR